MNFFRGIPTEIEDAAVIDGANQLQILFRVYLPISMPSLATIILFATVANWNCWMDGYMYMNTPDKYPLQTYLATILMESKNNVETLMTPEQLIRMAKKLFASNEPVSIQQHMSKLDAMLYFRDGMPQDLYREEKEKIKQI